METSKKHKVQKFSTLEDTRNSIDIMVAYPDNLGIHTKLGLFDWEDDDDANRQLQFAENEDKAKDVLSSILECFDRLI